MEARIKVGRNNPCPCGSGKKFKHCHLGQLALGMERLIMSKFTETVKQDTPRLVITFKREGDNEQFQWGLMGGIPPITIVGHIIQVQHQLIENPVFKPCEESAFVMAWEPKRKGFIDFLHPDIPTNSLLGMLEIVKESLVSAQIGQAMMQNQTGIVAPDGRPIPRRQLLRG